MDNAFTAAVLTISDKGSQGLREDTAGPVVRQMLEDTGFSVTGIEILPDEIGVIKAALIRAADVQHANLVVTVGGTGFAPRDVTPEATLEVCERLTPGIPEAMRAESLKITKRAMLSRASAGIRGRTLIVNLPGSEKAARENLAAVLDGLRHGLDMLLEKRNECASILMEELTHIDEAGRVRMVDVGDKAATKREAEAQAVVTMKAETRALIVSGGIPKGDVFAAARIAGIMAAKQTSALIPLCHPLPLDSVTVELTPCGENQVYIRSIVRCTYHTGAEMEALTAASVAALTIYDMCKAVDRAMEIGDIMLLRKSGGKSGAFSRTLAPSGEQSC